MRTLRFILGDQLSHGIATLNNADRENDIVLMVEVSEETTYVPHHKQKVALILAAMRHFAAELRADGWTVDYVRLEDPGNTGSFIRELDRAVERHEIGRISLTQPGEWRVYEKIKEWRSRSRIPLDILEDNRFFVKGDRFARWAERRSELRMEFFYREMRRETGLLMKQDGPVGGRWNFDADNRKRLPKGQTPPHRRRFPPDAMTSEVLSLVQSRFGDHYGDLETFDWAVNRSDALKALDDFIENILPRFGDFQDAMAAEQPFLYHSLIAPYLNIGLLTALEVCTRAEAAYYEGTAPLNAVEGFIRQILGWREYVRGIYWLLMPDYAQSNALNATRPLPALYWSGETDMRCMAEVVAQTRRHAYSHHIQRLMVTGNFALLAGINPTEITAWYLAVYADAFEWVVLPNTHGMAVFADGGVVASKPYAASGAYINRMSDFCDKCTYDVKQKSGANACPFNYLYWAFLIRNEEILRDNPRMMLPYRTLVGWSEKRKAQVVAEAEAFLSALERNPT